jgi:tetratricopeptide (TPR) repeat protein
VSESLTRLLGRTVTVTGDAYFAEHQYFYRPGCSLIRFQPAAPTSLDQERRLPPSELLAARYRILGFIGRESELAGLGAWRDDPRQPRSVHLVHAPGGAGKSRLATHFAEHTPANWTVLIAERGNAGQTHVGEAREGPALLLLDYAERWTHDNLEDLLCADLKPPTGKLRVLLLARTAGPWWQALRHALGKAGYAVSDKELAPLGDSPAQRQVVFDSAVRRFAPVFDVADPGLVTAPGELAEDALSLQMAALVATDAYARGAVAPTDPEAFSAYILDREYHHWERLAVAGRVQVQAAQLGRLAVTATLTGALVPEAAAALLQKVELADSAATAHERAADHAVCYPPRMAGTVLEPLRPDRLGEDLLGRQLRDGWLARITQIVLVDASVAAGIQHQAWTVLVEVGRRWPQVAEEHLYPLLTSEPALIHRMGGTSLAGLAEYAPIAVLEALEPALPPGRNVHLDLAVAVISRRLTDDRLTRSGTDEDRAGLYYELSSRLANAGLHAESLTAAERAVAGFQAAKRTAVVTARLAAAYNQLGMCLTDAGRGREALTATRKATEVMGALARIRDEFVPAHAMALNNLAVDLVARQRYAEAETAAAQAVRLTQAAIDRRGATVGLRAQLALALNNQGLARGDDLELLQQAVDVCTQNAREDPLAHEPELARCLVDLARAQNHRGDLTAALATIRDATARWTRLAEHNPAAFRERLLRALAIAAELAARAGDPAEARAALRRRAELSRANDGQSAAEIADEWNTTGLIEQALGRWREATAAFERSVGEAARLADREPDIYLPLLARLMTNLNVALWRSSRGEEAVAVSTATVVVYRELAARHTGHYDAALANALHNLAVDLFQAGRWADGQQANAESIDVLRALTVHGGAGHAADLAGALQSAALDAHLNDQNERARPYIDEAVGLRRKLAVGSSGAAVADLVVAASTQAIVNVKLGDKRAAAKAAQRTLTAFRKLDPNYRAGYESRLVVALQWSLEAQQAAGNVPASLAITDEFVRLCRDLAGVYPRMAGILPLAFLSQAEILAGHGRPGAAINADEQAVAAYRARKPEQEREDLSITPAAWRVLREKQAALFNARGCRAREEGRFPAALELVGCAVDSFAEFGTVAHEIQALENVYLTLRDDQQYEAALALLSTLFDRHAAARTPSLPVYVAGILDAAGALRQLPDPLIVRDAHRDHDTHRHVAEHGEEVLKSRRFLLIDPAQDILEVLSGVTPAKRAALIAKAQRLRP